MSFRNEQRDVKDLQAEVIRRLDDLERKRPPATPGGCDTPNIWCCTSLRRGGTTWTSALGDTRNLGTFAARHVADGGLSTEPNVLSEINIYDDAKPNNLSATQSVRWDIDLTTWWSTPGGANPADYSHPYFFDWNFVWAVVPPNWWAPGDPSGVAVTDGLSSPNANGIPINPTSVGSSGYDRLFLRIEYNPVTGSTTAWLATINDVTFSLVSQGTKTFAAATPGQGVIFDADTNVNGPLYTGWAPMVIHGVTVRQPANLGAVHAFQVNNIDCSRPVYVPGLRTPNRRMVGSTLVTDGSPFYQSYDSDYIISPRGAPVWLGAKTANQTVPIFDGADLADPVIAYSEYLDPGRVRIMEGVQPSQFVTTTFGNFVLAVADRATACSVDADGWPHNWWPFGTLHG